MNSPARVRLPGLSALAAGLLTAGVVLATPTAGGTQPASPSGGQGLQAPQRANPPEQAAAQPGTQEPTIPLAEHWLDVTPDTIERKTLVNSEGEKFGDVTGVVRNRETGEVAAVGSMGGFLGIGWLGGQDVAVPLKRMHLQANNVILFSQVTKEDLIEQEGAYRAEDYIRVEGGTPLGELAGATTFGELDKDGNGVLTRSESGAQSTLIENWDEYDEDDNDQIDRGEFGLFLKQQESSGKTPPEV